MQIELARSLIEQDSAAAREHLGEAGELSYRVQQELSALIDALHPANLQAKGVLPLLVVENSSLSPTRLTVLLGPAYPSFQSSPCSEFQAVRIV